MGKSFKFIFSLMLTLVLSMVVGSAVSYATGFNVAASIGTTFGASYLVSMAQILLPGGLFYDVAITSGYSGEVLAQLLVKATTGNELVKGGHIRLEPNVQNKFYIPRLKTGSMLQKRIEQPVDSDSKGDFTVDEKVLEPREFMAFTTFNPRSFEKFWRPFQPQGELVFRELPTHVQNQLLAELAKVVDFELGWHFINGEYGSGAAQLFNGIIYRIMNDSAVLKVNSNLVPLTRSNIIDNGLAPVRKLIPKALKKSPNLKIFMSVEDWELYDESLTLQSAKGVNHTDISAYKYKGIQLVPLADWPKDLIVATVASMDLDTNLWAAVDHVNDMDAIKIDRLTNAGERYFFKMLMKADTQIAFGEELVVFDGRSSATDILTFVMDEQTGAATINSTNHTVAITVANGTSKASLVATITLSPGATIDPGSGVELDYTSAKTFTVTASDGTEQAWAVTVTVASA